MSKKQSTEKERNLGPNADQKPEQNPEEQDLKQNLPEVVESNNPPALPASDEDLRPRRRRRRSREEIEAERQAERRMILEQATSTARVVVPALAGALTQFLPPPLSADEVETLTNAWAPVIAEYGGDLPPIAAAVVVTLAVFGPRVYARIAGHGALGTSPRTAGDGQDNPGASA